MTSLNQTLSLFLLLLVGVIAEENIQRLNPLFIEVEQSFLLMENTHILKMQKDINIDVGIEGFKFYSAYGVFFPKEFAIGAHKDYQCDLCDGDFKAIMIPKYLHPDMAQVCSESGCKGANEKGFIVVDVCEDHFTLPGTIDRIQINIYFSNSTKCSPKGLYDQFDCEAENFGKPEDQQTSCVTSHPYLLPLVQQRNFNWDT